MIKIEKDLLTPPASLNSALTRQRRQELINQKGYCYEQIYNSRYKMPDIKDALNAIYHHKCAFCEAKLEQLHVEHFRPKKLYYWLAYSWDNLLLACPTCNSAKLDRFDCLQEQKVFCDDDLDEIHGLAVRYSEEEQSQFVHPELEDVEGLIDFAPDGSISSEDARVGYTIDTCKLDRPYLREQRKKLFDDFEKKLKDRIAKWSFTRSRRDLGKIQTTLEDFAELAVPTNDFSLFRRFVDVHFRREPVIHIVWELIEQLNVPEERGDI